MAAQASDAWEVGANPVAMPAADRVDEPPIILPIEPDIEVVKNTREHVVVRVNDVLITQRIEHSTRESTRATLVTKDINSNEILGEMIITVSYEAGKYTTTLYCKNTKNTPTVFATDFDPLEPGALQKTSALGFRAEDDLLPPQGINRFWWDGVRYLCGTNLGMPFARPCADHYWICSLENVTLYGVRMWHFQLNRTDSQLLLGLPPIVIGGVLGIIIGTKVWPGLGSGTGALIGAIIGHVVGHRLIRRNLECDRGNIWIVVHRSLAWMLIPVKPFFAVLPRFLRIGRLEVWDMCPHISPIPDWRDG